MEKGKKRSVMKKAGYVTAGLLILAALIIVLLIAKPEYYIMYKQKTGMVHGAVNSFDPKEAKLEVSDTQVTYTGDIRYGDTYPNSYLDIYRFEADSGEKRPVFFFLHGGGYAWGDKAEGDPTAESLVSEEANRYLIEICRSGYQVVSINYALAPEYVYPVPVYQIDEAVRFLLEHQDEYGLDMTKVVFAGGSAGGQLAGQYANIQTNEAYAREMKMEQALGKENVLGVVFGSALLRPADFEKVDTVYFKWMFNELKKVYFGNSPEALAQADVIEYVSEDFPPTYITDGNHGTFDRQAKELAEKLEELGIEHVLNYYEKSEAVLEHGYDGSLNSEYALDNLEKELDFLKGLVSER